jgi:23S rRNA (uracil1939-C5)-methyltransferase
VPLALPGERLEVEAERTAKGIVHARVLRVLQPAPNRVAAPCPYFGSCGGCQYQHLDPQHQTLAKREILRETLRRIGKIIWDSEIPVHAATPWNYRNQARLKVVRQPRGHAALGFFEAESHRLFPIDVCLVLSPRLNSILGELRGPAWSNRLVKCREIEMLADDRDQLVMLTLRGEIGSDEGEALARDSVARLRGVATVAVEGPGKYRVFGEPALSYQVGQFRYQISPGSFFQASRFLLPELVAEVTRDSDSNLTAIPDGSPVAGVHERRALALDLFAGVGLFTLPLAQRFTQVIVVESGARAAADLAANIKDHGLANVRVANQTAFDFLRRFAQSEPDLVVLDPPRAGVGIATLKVLIRCEPKRLYYVSCSPPTLARDINYLLTQGYRLNSIELFDFFPQTYHIECLAKLGRSNLSGTRAAPYSPRESRLD